MFTAIINSRGSKYKEGLNSNWVFLKLHVQVLEWYCWIFLMNVRVNVALVLNSVSRKNPCCWCWLEILVWSQLRKISDVYMTCTLPVPYITATHNITCTTISPQRLFLKSPSVITHNGERLRPNNFIWTRTWYFVSDSLAVTFY